MFSGISRSMLIPVIVACALLMQTLDSTVIATALPQMAISFGASPVHLHLGITAYMISLAVFIPVSGWIADRFGSRTVFRAAIGVFTVGSILCGFSQNLLELAAARILQGIGGAMMVPVGRLVLLRSVDKSQLLRAMTYLTVPAMLGPAIGPPLGGFITTYASWRWIFFLNVPIGLLGIALVTLFFENHKEPETPPFDWIGFVLTASSLGAIMSGFELVGRPAFRADVSFGLLGAGFALGALAVRHSRRCRHPVLDLSLLRVPTFSASVVGGSVFRIGAGAMPFLLPLMLQVGFGKTAFVSGMLTFTGAVGAFTIKMASEPILRRFSFRAVLIGNGIISAASMILCGLFTPSTPTLVICLVLLIGGVFRSLQFTALNILGFADISAPRMSAASSFFSMMQQVAMAMGVAVGAILLDWTVAWGGAAAGAPIASDFRLAFVAVGLMVLGSVPLFLRLNAEAGAELRGPRTVPAEAVGRETIPADSD